MSNTLVARVARWKFEAPLAAALGGATLFAVLAQPPLLVALVPALAASLVLRGAFGIVAGCLLGALGYLAMRHDYAPRRRDPEAEREREEANDVAGNEAAMPAAAAPANEVSVRLRRADRHPDAPAREPIRALEELGSPFMEVAAPAAIAPLPPLPIPPRAPEVVAEPEPVSEVTPEPIVPEAAPVEAEVVTAEVPAAEPAPAESVEPVAEAAPVAAAEPRPAPARQSLAAMMERLSAGFAERAANSDEAEPRTAGRRRDLHPELAGVLDELNRLAARRAAG